MPPQAEPQTAKKSKSKKNPTAKASGRKSKSKDRAPKLTAKTADRHKLYELSVQDVETDEEFLAATFREIRGRDAKLLREDFCGTALLAGAWVKADPTRKAIGVDLDAETLEWGRENNLARLGKHRDRVSLLEADVLTIRKPKVDILCAFNFSYFLFTERPTLLEYFKVVRSSLKPDGLFFLDIYGGPEAQTVCKDRRRLKGFTYIWDQASFNPITHQAKCKIHSRFKDGTALRNAFVYEWRLWTLAEVRDLLIEAGFQRADVYWEGTDEDGEFNGEYEPIEDPENDPSWISYIVGVK